MRSCAIYQASHYRVGLIFRRHLSFAITTNTYIFIGLSKNGIHLWESVKPTWSRWKNYSGKVACRPFLFGQHNAGIFKRAINFGPRAQQGLLKLVNKDVRRTLQIKVNRGLPPSELAPMFTISTAKLRPLENGRCIMSASTRKSKFPFKTFDSQEESSRHFFLTVWRKIEVSRSLSFVKFEDLDLLKTSPQAGEKRWKPLSFGASKRKKKQREK